MWHTIHKRTWDGWDTIGTFDGKPSYIDEILVWLQGIALDSYEEEIRDPLEQYDIEPLGSMTHEGRPFILPGFTDGVDCGIVRLLLEERPEFALQLAREFQVPGRTRYILILAIYYDDGHPLKVAETLLRGVEDAVRDGGLPDLTEQELAFLPCALKWLGIYSGEMDRARSIFQRLHLPWPDDQATR